MPTSYCRHIRATGRRCKSPAVRGKVFCFYHAAIHDVRGNFRQRPGAEADAGPLKIQFPSLEDPESIQLALSTLVAALGDNRMEVSRARTILYGLRVASQNIDNLLALKPICFDTVDEVVVDENGTEIACDEDPASVVMSQELLRHMDDEDTNESNDYLEVGHDGDEQESPYVG